MKIFVVTGSSESGDDYGPEVFKKKPTEEQLKSFVKSCEGVIDGEGPGVYGSYIHLKVTEKELMEE